jgi:hypothetical protein
VNDKSAGLWWELGWTNQADEGDTSVSEETVLRMVTGVSGMSLASH